MLPLFCNRDLEINRMILKIEGNRDVLKMHPHTENEADSLRHSKLSASIEKYKDISRLKVKVKMSKALNYFKRYRNKYSIQDPAISGQ